MFIKLLLWVIFSFSLLSCGNSMVRVAPDNEECSFSLIEQKQLAEAVAQSVEESSLVKRPDYKAKKAVWILGPMANDTDEHINTDSFLETIQAKLIQTGWVQFADNTLIQTILAGKSIHNLNEADLSKLAKDSGAQFILRSRISNIRKNELEKNSNVFQFTFQVVSLETRQVLWAGEITSITCEKIKNKERESLYLKKRR